MYLFWKAELQGGRDENDLPFASPLPKWLQWTASWSQEPTTWVVGHKHCATFHYFPQAISRDLDGKWNSQDTNLVPLWDAAEAGSGSACCVTHTGARLKIFLQFSFHSYCPTETKRPFKSQECLSYRRNQIKAGKLILIKLIFVSEIIKNGDFHTGSN